MIDTSEKQHETTGRGGMDKDTSLLADVNGQSPYSMNDYIDALNICPVSEYDNSTGSNVVKGNLFAASVGTQNTQQKVMRVYMNTDSDIQDFQIASITITDKNGNEGTVTIGGTAVASPYGISQVWDVVDAWNLVNYVATWDNTSDYFELTINDDSVDFEVAFLNVGTRSLIQQTTLQAATFVRSSFV